MRQGFTLIELMIVIAIIAIIAAIAIPNLLESRVTANEANASASLKSAVFAGQVQFMSGGYQDRDADGTGEYGSLDQLSGQKATTRANAGTLRIIQGPLASAVVAGAVSTGSYLFVSQLPSTTDATQATTAVFTEVTAVATQNAAAVANTGADNGEKYFAVGAAPVTYGTTARRSFIISNDGMVRSPATIAADTIWLGAAPANGVNPAAASIILGIANAYGGATPTFADDGRAVTYPVVAK